jgi:hypothetical protein
MMLPAAMSTDAQARVLMHLFVMITIHDFQIRNFKAPLSGAFPVDSVHRKSAHPHSEKGLKHKHLIPFINDA